MDESKLLQHRRKPTETAGALLRNGRDNLQELWSECHSPVTRPGPVFLWFGVPVADEAAGSDAEIHAEAAWPGSGAYFQRPVSGALRTRNFLIADLGITISPVASMWSLSFFRSS